MYEAVFFSSERGAIGMWEDCSQAYVLKVIYTGTGLGTGDYRSPTTIPS